MIRKILERHERSLKDSLEFYFNYFGDKMSIGLVNFTITEVTKDKIFFYAKFKKENNLIQKFLDIDISNCDNLHEELEKKLNLDQ